MDEKKKRLQAKQRQKDYKETKAENAKKTREKIILGACDVVALKNGGYPYLNFLLAILNGYVSDTDIKFMSERYRIENGKNRDGFRGVVLHGDGHIFGVMDRIYKDSYQQVYRVLDAETKEGIVSVRIQNYDHDPRTRYGN